MRSALLLAALLCAAPVSAQTKPAEPAPALPKVWTDADLRQPLPKLHRTPDPVILAAFKARSEAIPFGAGGFGVYEGPPVQAERAAPRWSSESGHPRYYAAQPLYPVWGWPVIRSYGLPAVRTATRPSAGRRR